MDGADEGNVFGREERVEKKDEVVVITKFERISGPFLLGKLAQKPKRTASKVKTRGVRKRSRRLSGIQLRVYSPGGETK